MNRYIFLFCAFLLALSGCTKSCTAAKDVQEQVLRIGTSPDQPPFESIDNTGQLVGFDIDLGRALGHALNKKVEFKQFDFDALILALKNGQVDLAMSGLSITSSRQKEITMVPYVGDGIKSISLLFWQSIPDGLTSFSDLAKLTTDLDTTISVQAGHFLQDFLLGEHIKIKALAGPPEQILDLKYKKSLAAALDTPNAQTLAGLHGDLKMLTMDLPKEKWDLGYGIGINKANAELTKDVTLAIEKLKSDGTVKSLEAKWLKGEK